MRCGLLTRSAWPAPPFLSKFSVDLRHTRCPSNLWETQSWSEWSSGLLLRVLGQGEMEGDTMAKDDRDVLELLKEELAFIEQGGYGRSVRTPWLPTSAFQDSLTCINFADPEHTHPCSECHLIDFVPAPGQLTQIPCHLIPLNEEGETIEDLEAQDNQQKLERTLKQWMRTTIQRIEEIRAAQSLRSSAK
jgi:hypothetical protein